MHTVCLVVTFQQFSLSLFLSSFQVDRLEFARTKARRMRITNIPSTSSKVKWKRRELGRKKKKKKIGEAVGGQCAIYRERNGPGNELPC